VVAEVQEKATEVEAEVEVLEEREVDQSHEANQDLEAQEELEEAEVRAEAEAPEKIKVEAQRERRREAHLLIEREVHQPINQMAMHPRKVQAPRNEEVDPGNCKLVAAPSYSVRACHMLEFARDLDS